MLTTTELDLHREVIEALEYDPKVFSAEIGTAVEAGVVTLTGTVHSLGAKWAAELATRRVKGVRGIANEIKVDLPGTHVHTDRDIVQTAVMLLDWDAFIPKTIQLTAQDGHVTLNGTAQQYYQKSEAQQALSRLTGVRSITNAIEVRSKVAPKQTASKIHARFQRAIGFDFKKIIVDAKEGHVILTGEVCSLAELDEALSIAWSAFVRSMFHSTVRTQARLGPLARLRASKKRENPHEIRVAGKCRKNVSARKRGSD